MLVAQASLSELLVRVATGHPHHSLYHLLALKNGNRGRGGEVIARPATSAGAVSHSVDQVGLQSSHTPHASCFVCFSSTPTDSTDACLDDPNYCNTYRVLARQYEGICSIAGQGCSCRAFAGTGRQRIRRQVIRVVIHLPHYIRSDKCE